MGSGGRSSKVEHRVVAPGAGGSSPLAHPRFDSEGRARFGLIVLVLGALDRFRGRVVVCLIDVIHTIHSVYHAFSRFVIHALLQMFADFEER